MAGVDTNVVSMEWVAERLNDTDVILADCRFALGAPLSGRTAYEESHLPGALYFDLEKDLSGPQGAHGGRHPMPDLGVFCLELGRRGISEKSTVVAYDDQGGAMASRLWWMLRLLGHQDVRVMNGGFTAWKERGLPVTSEAPASRAPRTYAPTVRNELLVSMEDVKELVARGGAGTVLIDSREPKRYRGEEEPIDPVAGHIPGAVNYFWKDNLSADGAWKSPGELRERFSLIPAEQEIIVYCGSGVTACPNVLALAEAGRPDAKLYLGSWSDWISYEGNPVAVGEEEKA